jgi:hypothetical protein
LGDGRQPARIRESRTVFAIPTYVFLVSMLAMIASGSGARCSATSHRSATFGRSRSRQVDRAAALMRAFADG